MTVTTVLAALERLTVKTALVVPLLPSVMVTSLIVREIGGGGTSVMVTVAVGSALRRTETLLPPWFATAKSDLPSLLKSPTVTELGKLPTEKLVAVPKLPVPVPNSTDTLPPLKFATAKSDLPSPLKSPTVTELGFPTVKLVAVPKLPVPVPNSTDTL